MSRYRFRDSEISADSWDRLVAASNDGTLFHTRRFLSYHRDRFADGERLLDISKGDTVIGVLPIYVADGRARTPYGASVGGFALSRRPGYGTASAFVAAFIEWLVANDISECAVGLPPVEYHAAPDETLQFSLREAGFELTNADAVHMVELTDLEAGYEGRCRTAIKRAIKAGVTVRHRVSVDSFWPVLMATYAKHGTDPTHSEVEWRDLCDRLGDAVWCSVAELDGVPIAGLGAMQLNTRVGSSFYLAADPAHRDTQAQTLLIHGTLTAARDAGTRWFDFGTSSVAGVARPQIFRFKESFGAVARFRRTLHWRAS